MPDFGPERAAVDVLTFKEGLFSPVAHDLRIEVQEFEVTVEDGRVEGEFDLSSLVVSCAQKDGRDAIEALSTDDKAKIERAMHRDVLHTHRYPDCLFEADLRDIENDAITGELELHGESHPVTANIADTEDGLTVSVHVHQPDFGIKPYTAMLGSIRIRPDVIIKVCLNDITIADLLDA